MTNSHHPLQDRQLSLSGADPLIIHPGVETARFSLRIDPAALGAASDVFGLALPDKLGGFVSSLEGEGASKAAVMIGPDEWYLTAPQSAHDQIIADFAKLYETQLHSLVDISNREISIVVEGARAAWLLQAVMAFDVEKMSYPSGRRTLFERVQIILLREREDRFSIEVWASFAEHVWNLLEILFNEVKSGL